MFVLVSSTTTTLLCFFYSFCSFFIFSTLNYLIWSASINLLSMRSLLYFMYFPFSYFLPVVRCICIQTRKRAGAVECAGEYRYRRIPIRRPTVWPLRTLFDFLLFHFVFICVAFDSFSTSFRLCQYAALLPRRNRRHIMLKKHKIQNGRIRRDSRRTEKSK